MTVSSDKRMGQIRQHFQREAKRFDKCFFKVAPFYKEAIEALILSLPFKSSDKVRVVDLGCGTGNITQALLGRYPKASVSCVDMADNMVSLAKAKLRRYPKVNYWVGDIRGFDYSSGYNAVISSLVLHHLEKKDKRKFYRHIFDSLPAGGVFYTADIVLPYSKYLAEMYVQEWKKFMRKSISSAQVSAVIKRHHREDRPAELIFELDLLREVGFREVEVVWKRYNFAVYGGRK